MKYIVNDFETRYFAGIELIGGLKVDSDDFKKIPKLWDDLMDLYISDIPNKTIPNKCIGLEMYRFDFMESKTLDYFALVEITNLFEANEEVVTKKLPKGKYISFPILFDDIRTEIQKVYNYIEKERINVHLGFDVEEYLPTENYNKPGAKLYLTFKLENN